MYKGILLFCIFCNFFSVVLLNLIGAETSENFILRSVPRDYILQANIEMSLLFTLMIIISQMVKSPKRQRVNVSSIKYNFVNGGTFVTAAKIFYFVCVLSTIVSTNWGGDLSSRGEGQFELANRQTFFQGLVGGFYLPFMLYIYIVGVFKNNKMLYLALGLLVYLLNGILSGGRSEIVLSASIFFLYIYYMYGMKTKRIVVFLGVILIALSFSANDRFGNNDPFMNIAVKIIQCNSSSYFLPTVKYSIQQGVDLTPWTFCMHFVSIFIPSYIWVSVFNVLSYVRSTFVFDEMWNTNKNSGLGFMMLADFYWCFKYWGYALYLLVYYWVLKFFSKNIYDRSPVRVIMAIMAIELFCNQRADFGVFVKPFAYTFIFLSFFEYLRKSELKKKAAYIIK